MKKDTTVHPDLLTVQQVADRLQLGRNKVYALVNSHAIPAFRVGGSIRVPREALGRWVDAQCQSPKALSRNQ